jgi:hypothetical protein
MDLAELWQNWLIQIPRRRPISTRCRKRITGQYEDGIFLRVT